MRTPKTTAIIFRVSPEDRAAMKIAAGAVSLSEWVRSLAVRESRKDSGAVTLSESFVRALEREAREVMEGR